MDKDNTTAASSPPKKESNQNSPRYMKGFKMIMFIGKQAKKNAGTDISGRKARSVITAKKQQRKAETKELKAAVTTLLKKGSAPKKNDKKGGKRAREEGSGEEVAVGEEQLHILDNDDDDDGGYADVDDDNNNIINEDDRYLDANYEHVPNGLDIMFATTQRNPALMHPPKDRFECRDKLVSGGMYKEARELEKAFINLCEKEEGIIRKRAEDAAAAASGGVVSSSSPSRLAQMTSPSTQRQRAAAAGKRKDMEVRTMLSLLGAKLGKSSNNNNNTSEGATTTTTTTATADNDATAAPSAADEVELRDIETKKMDLQAKYTKLATTDVASATHHHKQLDAYLTCLLEFNHNLFGTLPLKDTLYNCSRLSKTDAGMRVLTFEEHTKALRKRRIETEMERTFWNPQQQNSSTSTTTNPRIASNLPNGVSTTDFDIEQIQLRAAAFMGSKPATTTAVSNEIPEDGSWEELLAHQNNGGGAMEDDFEAEYEDLRGDMDDHHQHRADHEMDPYEYLMLYGVPPPSMMGAAADADVAPPATTTTVNTAAEKADGEEDTPIAPLVEQTNSSIPPTPNQEVEEPSTFTATLNIGNDEDTSSVQ